MNSIFNNTIVLSVIFAVLAGTMLATGITFVLGLDAVLAMVVILCGGVGTGTVTAIVLAVVIKDESQ